MSLHVLFKGDVSGIKCLCTISDIHFFCTILAVIFRPRFFSLSRLRGTQMACMQMVCAYTNGATLRSGRAPWRVRLAFKVAGSWLFSRDRFGPRARAQEGDVNTHTQIHTAGFSHRVRVCCELELAHQGQPGYNSSLASSFSLCGRK